MIHIWDLMECIMKMWGRFTFSLGPLGFESDPEEKNLFSWGKNFHT